MNLQYFVSCWGNEVDHVGALLLAGQWQADGIEGPPPKDGINAEALRERSVPWIAEVATGGGYVPAPHRTSAQHLDDLRCLIEASMSFSPLLINALAGSDTWSFRDQVRFYEEALQAGLEMGVPIAFETHRSRPTFNPWITRDLLVELPDLRLTCDFSHWCAVCERLIMDEEPELLELFAIRALHVHARVGYDQGPQVPDPRAPAHAAPVEAHLRWWRHIAATQVAMGAGCLTFTPEFGPDGYLHCEPFSQQPVAHLGEVNHWMMQRLQDVMKPF